MSIYIPIILLSLPHRGRSPLEPWLKLERHQAIGVGVLVGFTDHLEVHEVGEGLTGGHIAPGPLAE